MVYRLKAGLGDWKQFSRWLETAWRQENVRLIQVFHAEKISSQNDRHPARWIVDDDNIMEVENHFLFLIRVEKFRSN